MKIVRIEEITPEPVRAEGACGTSIRYLIRREDGAPHFAMRMFELEAGGSTPLHTHRWEHEVFILEGKGAVRHEEKEFPLCPGTAVLVLPGEKHCFRNTGESPLRFLCLIPHHGS